MSLGQQWVPRSIECLRGYTATQFSQDLIAGLTVGLVALPLAMAFLAAMRTGNSPRASSIAMTSRSLLAVSVPWLRWPVPASA